MSFPEFIEVDDVRSCINEWKISGYEVTLYQDTLANPLDLFLFVQLPIGERHARVVASFEAADSGYKNRGDGSWISVSVRLASAPFCFEVVL